MLLSMTKLGSIILKVQNYILKKISKIQKDKFFLKKIIIH